MLCSALSLSAGPTHAADTPQDRLYLVLADEDREPDDPAAVVAFSVDEFGSLSQQGTCTTAGYSSARDSLTQPSVDSVRGRLFVANNMSNDLSVLTIRDDGSLDPVPGSPFPAGEGPCITTLHPSGRFLYVSQWRESTIGVYEVTDSGQLVALQTVGYLHPMHSEVTPDGQFLYVACLSTGVHAYGIADDGSLTELSGSPFTYPAMDRPSGIELSSDGSRLFVLDYDAGVAAFHVDGSGSLDAVAGSPFPLGDFSPSFVLTQDDRHVYAGLEGQVQGFEVFSDGSLGQLPGSPYYGTIYAWALIHPPGAPWLLAGNLAGQSLRTLAIAEDGALTQTGSDVTVEDPLERIPNGAVYYRPSAGSLDVDIDIKPDNGTNPINPRSYGVTPVALLGSADFDVTAVDVTTLRFGPGEAAPAHDLTDDWSYREPLRDVNLDGFTDLLAHFDTQETGIQCGDTAATLTGQLMDGTSVEGTDAVRTVGCSHRAARRKGQ